MKASDFSHGDRVRWLIRGVYHAGTVAAVGNKYVHVTPDNGSGIASLYPITLQHIDSDGKPL